MAACLALGCGSTGDESGALLSVVVDGAEGVENVGYDVECEGAPELNSLVEDALLESLGDTFPPVYEGFLELPAGVCEVALTALGADGSPICSASLPIDVAPGTIDESTILMPCDREEEVVNNINIQIDNLTLNVCFVVVVGARNIGGDESIIDRSSGDVELEVTTIGQCSDRDAPEVLVDAAFTCPGVDCTDDNECTLDVCVEGATCANPPTLDGVACGGGVGVCLAGECILATE